MRIDICVPAFNEEKIIAEAVASVRTVLSGITDAEHHVIVADNGSTDDTASRAEQIEDVSVLSVPNRGKGAAVVAAAGQSTADVFGFIDADLSADPNDILKLLEPLVRNECDIAIGSRLIDTSIIKREWLRTFLSRLFNLVRRVVLGVGVSDTQCGLKLMNVLGRNVLAGCEERGWFFDIEFLAQAERANLRIVEIPIHWNEHRFEGRKSKLNLVRDGFGTLGALARIYFRTMSK